MARFKGPMANKLCTTTLKFGFPCDFNIIQSSRQMQGINKDMELLVRGKVKEELKNISLRKGGMET